MSVLYGTSLTTMLMFVMCTSTMAGFAQIPANVTTELGTALPPCRCHHTSSDAFITWRVNGSPVGQFPGIKSGYVNESGTIVYTLTIPAEPQYNGTVVECLAVFLDGSPTEVSPPATIVFTPTDSLPVTFEITPSPLTVAVEQGTATFQCQHPLADVTGWRVNGMPLNVDTLQNVSTASFGTLNGVTTILSIATLLVFNGITVECVATFFDGSSPQFTPPVALRIQDTPKRIENAKCQRDYSEDELTTLWNPLPTLDINDTDPDILYTVDLYQITCGQNILINRTEVAGSNVTEEGLDLMQIYKAIIAARNNVQDARSGPSVQMKETFMSLNGPTLLNLIRNPRINMQSGAPVPSYYEMILESLDGLYNNFITNITVERNGEMIDMSVEESVPPNSLWRASILAYGCESDRIVSNYELSTHDIQNVAISQLPGQISVTGDFVGGATATGVLVVVYSPTYIHYISKQTVGDRISLDVTGLTGAEYGVSTFALENGLPLPGVVASPKNITVLNSHQDGAPQQPPLIEYELVITNTSHVCITCTFLDSSATDCVAVVHQQISQLSSSGLMNIESSHKFIRSGDIAYGCIEGVNLKQYQVGVIGGKMIVMELNNDRREFSVAGAVTGVFGGVVVAILIAVAMAVIVLYTCLKKKHRTTALVPVYSEVIRRSDSQVQAVVDTESGSRSAVENLYAKSAGLSEKSPEEQPLLTPPLPSRVTSDGAEHDTLTAGDPEEHPPPLPPRLMESADLNTSALPHQVTVNNLAGDPTYAPVLPRTPRVAADGASTPPQGTSASPHQVTSDNGFGDPTYAPVLTTSPNAVSQPAATEKVSYEDIQKYQNEQGQHYALPQLEVASKKGPVDDLHQVVYVKVKPHSLTPSGDQNIHCTSDYADDTVAPSEPIVVREPLTTDELFSFLLPHAAKWQSLGLALSLDKDQLEDEVFTNNEREEECLREMLELYMMRSDLNHSWEEIKAALEKIESTSDVSTSVQEASSSQSSPIIGGKTMLVPDRDDAPDASTDHDQQPAVGTEESSNSEEGISDSGHSGSQLESSDSNVVLEMEVESTNLSLPEASEKKSPTSNSLSGHLESQQPAGGKEESRDHEEQEGNSDSGYSGSQQSESETSDSASSVSLEIEKDSTNLSQAPSEAPERNRPSLLSQSGDIDVDDHKYESELDLPSSSEAIPAGGDKGGGRTSLEKLPMLVPSTPTSTSSSDFQVGGFYEILGDQRRDEDLFKRSDSLMDDKLIHQESQPHKKYNEALMHQMGLQMYQKVRDKVDNNNVVEESCLVHNCQDRLRQQVQLPSKVSDKKHPLIKICTRMSCTTLDIPKVKVHNLVPLWPSVSPKYSLSLIHFTMQVENDYFVILFACVILLITYSSKLCSIINLCIVKMCVDIIQCILY